MIRRWWLSLFPKKCDMCGGTGIMQIEISNSWGFVYEDFVCRICRGTGKTR